MNHFDEMVCMLYLDGQLEADRARELRSHAGECAGCRALLRVLEEEGGWLHAALTEEVESVPARVLEPPARLRTPWGWIAAFGLATAGFYTLWNGMIAPWQQQLSDAGLNSSNLLTMLVFHGAFWKGWDSMRNLVEFVAVATLIAVVVGFSRKNWRRWTTAGMVFSGWAVALMFLLSASAAGAQSRNQASPESQNSVTVSIDGAHSGTVPSVQLGVGHVENYRLPANQTHHGDLIVSANFAHVDGTVEGDVIATAQDLDITGHVEGDVIVFARNLRISGQVDGSVRGYGQFISISGSVAHNVTAACENFQLDPGGKIGWSAIVWAGNISLDGAIGRNIIVGGKDTEINGTILGAAKLYGSRLNIGPQASVGGEFQFKGQFEPEIAAGAKLASPINFSRRHEEGAFRTGKFYIHRILHWGAAFIFGLVLLALMPVMFDRITRAGRGPGALIGLLVLFGVPIIAIIACVTLVGIPLGILTLLAYFVSLYAAQVFVGEIIGGMLMGRPAGFGASLGRLAVGLLIIHALSAIPHVGGWVVLVVIVWGLGAISMGLFRSVRGGVTATA